MKRDMGAWASRHGQPSVGMGPCRWQRRPPLLPLVPLNHECLLIAGKWIQPPPMQLFRVHLFQEGLCPVCLCDLLLGTRCVLVCILQTGHSAPK